MDPEQTDLSTEPVVSVEPTEAREISIVSAEQGPAEGAAAPPPTRPSTGLRARVRPIWLAAVAIPLAVAVGGGGWWAKGVLAELDRTRAAIAETRTETERTSADADQARTTLADEQAASTKAGDDGDSLQKRSSQATVCIAAQAGDDDDIQALLDKQQANVSRTASGSKFDDAYDAAWKSFETAVAYVHNAYKAVAAGNYSSANNWVDKSNAQIKIDNAQVKIMDREVKEINEVVGEINGAREALDRRVESTVASCSF